VALRWTAARVLEAERQFRRMISYRALWLFSRQRYWDCPIRILHCESAGSCR
jgi:leucyl-tRNA synthetase